MKSYKQYSILFLLIIALTSSAFRCHHNDDVVVPPNPNGNIYGTITPANSAARLICTPASGASTIILENPPGNFSIANLVPGTYILSIIPKIGYNAPSQKTLSITAGTQTNAGNFALQDNGQVGTITYTMDGTNYTINAPKALCSYTTPSFEVRGTTTSNQYWMVDIMLKNVTGTGTYNAATTGNFIQISHFVNATFTDGIWEATNGGAGTVIITELNTTTRVASGTFTATALPQGATVGGNKEITNGTFANLNF
jgi:hypothetical protein